MKKRGESHPPTTAARLAVRRGEFIQLRRRLLSQLWVWFALFVVGVAVVLAPGARRHMAVATPGEVAAADIVIDRDITLPDPDSTEQKRRRASQDVLPVYVLDPTVENAVMTRIERIFQEGRRYAAETPTMLAQRLAESGGVAVEGREAAALRSERFSEDVLAIVRDVVARIYRQGVVSDRLELLQSAARGVTLRSVGTEAEHTELDIYRFLDGTAGLQEAIEQRLMSEPGLRRSVRAPLAGLLGRVLVPNIVLDRAETLSRRLKAAVAVEEVSIHLARGRVLVRRGDEISPQTARVLAALAVRERSEPNMLAIVGVLVIASLLALAWFFFLRRQAPSVEEFRVRFGVLTVVTLGLLVLDRGFIFLAGSVATSVMREPFGSIDVYLPVLPHATGPILAGLMYGLPVGILFALTQGVLVTLMLHGDAALGVYVGLAGLAAAFASQRLKERNVLARAGIVVALVNAVAIVGLGLWQGRPGEGGVLAAMASAGALGGVIAAALASFMLPALESASGTITDIRLLELANPNLPLLKRLSLEAPGTFQHSLAMANLAEAAAEAIGANPLLARVCCYYHDIGKIGKPEYFVENQRGENPHDNLSPWMSSLVVSNHVKAGLELAREYRLPEPIRDAISTHHGTKLIRYFYSRAKEQADPDHGEVAETEFRYPGPRPRSKEMGILAIADAVEAASRTLHEPTPGKIQGMIDQIVKNLLEDEQLDDCELTLKDIEKVGAAFFWVLTNAFHHRIDYPGFDFNRRQRGEKA